MSDNVSNEQMMEIQGWLCERQDDGLTFWVGPMSKVRIRPFNFTTDLNLVHEIEAGLSNEEWVDYLSSFYEVSNTQYPEEIAYRKALRHADAQTCCDALYPILQERSKR
jgi:hypothetical protein